MLHESAWYVTAYRCVKARSLEGKLDSRIRMGPLDRKSQSSVGGRELQVVNNYLRRNIIETVPYRA